MNGLRFIRIQCNYSITELADKLEVSRQLVSAWENDKKKIPLQRLTQLATFFGIEEKYFGPISEKDKKELLRKAMFLYEEDGKEFYKYSIDIDRIKGLNAHFISERKITKNEELIQLKNEEKELLKRIETLISGSENMGIDDQRVRINRGLSIFELCASILEYSYNKKSEEKMYYFKTLLNVLVALNETFGEEDLRDCQNMIESSALDYEFIQQIQKITREQLTKELHPVVEGDKTLLNGVSEMKSPKEIKEKVKMIEDDMATIDDVKREVIVSISSINEVF